MSAVGTTLITGLPRSGTTLLCALLNKLPDTVALAEPLNPRGTDAASSITQLNEFIADCRETALKQGTVVSKHFDGRIVDDFMEAAPRQSQLRRTLERSGQIQIENRLSQEFRLFIKQPAWFTALARELKRHYEMLIIVRHPLAVLASWQTVDIPVHNGRMPNACRFDSELSSALDPEPDRLRRQVLIIDWALQIYSEISPTNLLRLEDLIRDPAATLTRSGIECTDLVHQFHSEPPEVRYPNVDLDVLNDALWPIRHSIRIFYPEF